MKREEQIFERAIGLPSPEAREDYLRTACAQDKDLRHRVEQLLAAFQDADQIAFLRTGERLDESPTSTDTPVTEGPGTNWTLQTAGANRRRWLRGRLHGRAGGAGPPKVALKIIKLGMDTKQVIARFEAERQALALMDHPNIAKVLDAGATDTRPPLLRDGIGQGRADHAVLRKEQAPPRRAPETVHRRLPGLQHAHQKGIIHRDIKPSNFW